MEKNTTIPWVEKYRPTQFQDIVLEPLNRKIFQNILEKNYFPNLLFYGPPGTGKTTTIINLINEFQLKYSRPNKNQIIHLNASDERGIDIIRNQILLFVKTNNLFENGLKFVILDEVDYMTKNAQQALKYLLQICNNNVKFCLICNYISKIDESLKNEFLCIRFNETPKEGIHQLIKTISQKENLNLSNDSIDIIQTIYNSDIRSMINFIQLNQNLKFDEWKQQMISRFILENIHELLISKTDKIEDVFVKIHQISIQYNIDKKGLFLKYFDFIIREKSYLISNELLNAISDIFHNNDTKTEQIIKYFCYRIRSIYTS